MTAPASPAPSDPSADNIYGRTFWLSYAANLTMVAANAVTFRFAELVKSLGGSDFTTGQIVSAGTVGAILSRFVLGPMLDRYGTRRVWAFSGVLFAFACGTLMTCESISPVIFAARIAFATGIAGMSTASIVHIQHEIPWHRRTEVIGNFGSSGFLGMVVGALCGDGIYWAVTDVGTRFVVMFGLAAALGLAVATLAILVTRGHAHVRPEVTPGLHRLLFRYWPGTIILVGMMIGVSLAVTTVFLTRMVKERDLGGMSLFFFGYCGSAFAFRVASSSWSRVVGRRWLVLFGLAGHGFGHLLLANATEQWHLIIPAVTAGFGHAMLFPSVVSIGSGAFPKEYRGTGTTVVLGFTELGIVISGPILGAIIDLSRARGLADPFAPMFYASASFALFAAIAYWWSSRGEIDEEQQAAKDADAAIDAAQELNADNFARIGIEIAGAK